MITALDGIRVLEFSHTIMGPSAGMVMADLGADVIKVEASPDGDPTRRLPGFAAGFFPFFNRSKRSVAIDLKRPEGKALVRRLVARADVVIENYGPGTMERLDAGYDELSKVNPRLVYLALKGFLSGPYEHRPALDEVVQFMSGLAYMTGPPGRPLRAGTSIVDIMGGSFGVIGVLAALRERDKTGRGQLVKSALFESAVLLMGQHLAGEAVTGAPVPPMPARKNAWGVYDVFTASDGGQVFIGCTSDGHWHRFCETFGFDDWRDDPRLAGNTRRCEAREWMLPELERRITKLPLNEILQKCEAARVAYSRVGRPDELSFDPHLLAHGGLLATAVSGLGGGPLVGIPALPVEFGDGRERAGLDRQPPKIGEHAHEILSAAGYSEHEIIELRAAGVLGEVASVPA